jgi:hypothetical protein
MACGNQGQPIFRDDKDRHRFLEALGETCGKTGCWIHACVLMGGPKAGDGAPDALLSSGEPDESPTGKEVEKIETMSFKHGRKDRMRNQYCHFSRTDASRS